MSTALNSGTYISAFALGLTAAAACMALFAAVVMVMPIAAPLLWLGVPIALLVGMAAIHRRVPRDTYIVGLFFVPVVGALLVLAALQVYWTLGDSI